MVAGDRRQHDHRGHDDRGDDLGRGPTTPAESVEDRRGGEHGHDGQEGLPADRDQPRDDAGHLLSLHAEAARDRIMVGAEPRLPAIAMMPQRAKDTTTPMTVTRIACQKEMPKPRTNAAYEMPKTEMLAANHGQKRSRGPRCARPR